MKYTPGQNIPQKYECQIPGKCGYSIWGKSFELDEKYVPIKGIGKGAYGIVISAKDTQKNEIVAIKKIDNTFKSQVDAIRTLREICILRNLNHKNIVRIKNIIKPVSKEELNDVYVVYECMDTDLHQIIISSQPLTELHCQFFIWQLLNGLKYLHSAQIIHRDLKPSNLLLNADCDLKICDFGLARTSKGNREDMTQYVVTRWYRAPELFLSSHYTSAIDMWSVGCILGELLLRKPLFQDNKKHPIQKIIEVVGIGSNEDIKFIEDPILKEFCKFQVNPETAQKFHALFAGCSAIAVDLLQKLLQFNPEKRLTAGQALEHPWLAEYHCPSSAHESKGIFTFDFDDTLSTVEIRELVYRECQYWQMKQAAVK